MKIVNLEAFRAMPAGTVYSKFNPHAFEGLMTKGDTLEHDFIYQDLIGNIDADDSGILGNMIDDAMEDDNVSLPLDFNCCGRDGLFDEGSTFCNL